LRVPALVGMCYCAGCVTGPSAADAKVAITSWRWLLKLPGIDQTKLTQFVQKHYADPNYAPEANIP